MSDSHTCFGGEPGDELNCSACNDDKDRSKLTKHKCNICGNDCGGCASPAYQCSWLINHKHVAKPLHLTQENFDDLHLKCSTYAAEASDYRNALDALRSAVLLAVPNLPDEFDWKDAERLIRQGIQAERGQCSLCSREHGPDCDLAFATCTCKSVTSGELQLCRCDKFKFPHDPAEHDPDPDYGFGSWQAEKAIDGKCNLPPAGWYCTRQGGHEGPCAAWPDVDREPCIAAKRPAIVRAFEWMICQLFRGHDEVLFMIGKDQDLYECQRCGVYHGRSKA